MRHLERSKQNSPLQAWLEGLFLLLAVAIGWLIAAQGFSMAGPLLLAMAGFVLLRYGLQKPFYQALTFYVAIAAFNYYYFYCANFTGRNPTDVGDWGIPATSLEKAQKDIVFFCLLGMGAIKLFQSRLAGFAIWPNVLAHPIYGWLGAFFAYVILRGIFWIIHGDTSFDMLFYFRSHLEWAVLPFLMASVLITRQAHLEKAFKGIFYALPVVAVLGIVEFFLNGSPFHRNFYGGQEFSRVVSTLQNPNNLGGYLATALGVLGLFFFSGRLTRWERWGFWPTVPMGLVCLFMTISRSSWATFLIAFTLSLGLWFYGNQRATKNHASKSTVSRYGLWLYLLILLVSVGVLYRFFDLNRAIYNAFELYGQSEGVGNARFFAPGVTLSMLLENPLAALFGYSKLSVSTQLDNAFANILLRNGVVGFVLFCGVWAHAWWASAKQALAVPAAAAEASERQRHNNTSSSKFSEQFNEKAEEKAGRHFGQYQDSRGLSLVCFFVLTFQFLYAFTAPVNENFPHNLYFWLTIGAVGWLCNPAARRS